MHGRVWSAIALLLAVAVLPAFAQRTTGEIIGKVTDESGGALPGVTVTLRGAGVAGTPAVPTSETGTYRFPLLPPGTYELDFMLEGFTAIKRPTIPVAVGASVVIDVKMAVGAIAELVTVQGSAPVVNVAAAEVSTTYNREWVENAPTKRFSYFDLVNSSPGVSGTSNVGQSSSAQSMGSATNENQYQIDGTNISSTPWVSGDAVEEVEVLQLGASAQYGNVQGAVFNIVTRQGSNQFHGDLSYYHQSNGLTSRNTTDTVDSGRPYNRDTYSDTSVQAGGPFVRDKLWFFGAFQNQRDYDSQPGVDPRFPAKNDARRVFWKFNWNITENHRFLHGYHDDYYWIPDVPTAFTAETTLGLSHGDNPTPNFVYTGVLSSTTFVEARYSGFWLNSSNDPNLDGTPRVLTRYVDDRTGNITGGITSWTENRSYRNSFSGKLSKYTDKGFGGSHDLAIGLQYGVHGSDQLNGPNDVITTTSTGTQRGTTQLPYHQGARVNWTGAYFEDTVRMGRAALNLGVRYDYSKASFPAFPLLDALGNETGVTSTAVGKVYDWSTFSPRLGINVRLTDSGSAVVKAHYGRYYKELEQGEFRVAVPSITPSYEFGLDAAGNRINLVQVSSNANLRIDPDTKAPYTDQYMVQYEQEVMRNLGFQFSLAHKRGEAYTGWADTTGTYEPVTYVDNVGADTTGESFTVYRLTSSPASRVFLMTNPDGMYTRYRGATFMLTKRMSNNWQAVGSLVLSKAEGRLGSSARAQPTTTASSTAGTFARDAAGPNDFVNTDGLLIGDRPVVAKLQIVYRLPLGVMVSANMQHQTGRAYARQVRISTPGLGFPTAPQINVEPLDGSRRVADVDLIDFRAQKEFTFAPMRFAVFLDALNMTNSDSYEGVASVLGTAASFGVGTRYIPPRRLQLGAKFRW